MKPVSYTTEAQQRLLSLIDLLAGHELRGLEPGALARALNCHASTMTRDLANLHQAGWAERTPESDAWRLSPHVIQLSLRHAAALAAGEQALRDVAQRFSRF